MTDGSGTAVRRERSLRATDESDAAPVPLQRGRVEEHAEAPRRPWQPKVTRQRVESCCDSAQRWSRILPWYANTMQRRADRWAMAAGIIAALTSVAVWPAMTESSTILERAIVSAGALAAAICALPPRVKNHGELAARARALAARYGTIRGDLDDLLAAFEEEPDLVDDAAARRIIDDFERTKALKDQLRGLPSRDFQPKDSWYRTL